MTTFFETEQKLNEQVIGDFEAKYDFRLRDEFKTHLLNHNGGRCEPSTFSFVENGVSTESLVDWFLAIYDGEYDNFETYFQMYKVDLKRMPNSFFPIAHDPGGNLICIDNETGGVYFWDHENEVDYAVSEDKTRTNLFFISSSLKEFLSKLY